MLEAAGVGAEPKNVKAARGEGALDERVENRRRWVLADNDRSSGGAGVSRCLVNRDWCGLELSGALRRRVVGRRAGGRGSRERCHREADLLESHTYGMECRREAVQSNQASSNISVQTTELSG